ncbi:MAG: hypothetical protein K0R15_2737 [Clostridiales bacterium]|jgi:hypothetical protein|nr:hypothetical protein [Clostridiales bacterium]
MNKDKTIRIIYFSIVIVLAIIICVLYSDKKMFENRYNSEFYNNFKFTFLIDQPTFYECLETVDKAVKLQELSKEDIYFSYHSSNEINSSVAELKEFYADCYGYNKKNYYSNRNLKTIDQYIFAFGLREGSFYENSKGTFILNEDKANEYKQSMVNFIELVDIVEKFKTENQNYFAKLDKNGGKNFIKDGVWLELYNELNDYINGIR